MKWIASELPRDYELSGIVIYFKSIQEVTDADYSLLSANEQFTSWVSKGLLTVYDNESEWEDRSDVKQRTIRYTTKQTFSDKSLNGIPVNNELVTNVTVPEVIKELGPSPSGSLEYNLYAYEMSVDEDTIAYAEKPTPEVGDVIFLKATMSQGPITDPSELTVMGSIATVGTEGAITVEIHEGETPVAFIRKEDNDWTETITDVKDAVDVVTNGLIVADKGKVTKAVNVSVPTPEPEIVLPYRVSNVGVVDPTTGSVNTSNLSITGYSRLVCMNFNVKVFDVTSVEDIPTEEISWQSGPNSFKMQFSNISETSVTLTVTVVSWVTRAGEIMPTLLVYN